jgi:FtsP/CotA-like multicopper oxidase with cupredoxin domain
MTVIGSDGGLLDAAITRGALSLGPAQRADVLLDLSDLGDGDQLRLTSAAFPAGDAGLMDMMMMSAASGPPQGAPLAVLTLLINGRNTREVRLPDRLSEFDASWRPAIDAPTRRVTLGFQRMQWLLDGRVFEMEEVTDAETVTAGSTHVWELVNTQNPMGMEAAHPIHLHGRQFRVLGRSGGAPANALRPGLVDSGWTDTVLVLPGETVRVQVTFSEHPGLFLYHCHILEHEDMGMMRNFKIL